MATLERRFEQMETTLKHLTVTLKDGSHMMYTDINPNITEKLLEGTRSKREIVGSIPFGDLKCQQCPPGPPGRDGRDGTNGRDGLPGKDGHSGKDGKDGISKYEVHLMIDDRVKPLETKVNQLQISPNTGGGSGGSSGAVYTHWGRDDCPASSQLVYKGVGTGSYWNLTGGGANYQCLSSNPEFVPGRYTDDPVMEASWLFGMEYNTPSGKTKLFKEDKLQDNNVACSSCLAKGRGSLVMIPGQISCPSADWTMEYRGFLMTASTRFGHYRGHYICVDETAQGVPGSAINSDGSVIYHVKAHCKTAIKSGAIPACPPYRDHRELSCVVCTK